MEAYTVKMNNICKSFFNIDVLKDVSVTFNKGEIHAIVGKNGAGKTTLVKILAGIFSKDSGDIYIDGKLAAPYNFYKAVKMGISIANQDVSLFPHLRVYENILVGKESQLSGKTKFFLPDKTQSIRQAQDLLDRLGCTIDPMRRVSTLSLAEKQIIQFAHTIVSKPKILIVDEITAGLNSIECQRIFSVLNQLKAEGCCIIYISHQLSDMIPHCDKITVLRDGSAIGPFNAHKMGQQEIIALMLGHTLQKQYPMLPTKLGREVLRVTSLSTRILKDINFNLFEGEVLGIAGLLGSGRTSLILSIIGQSDISNGQIQFLNGSPARFSRKRFGIIPDNCNDHGLYNRLSVADNITISNLRKIRHRIFLSDHEEQIQSRDMMDRIGISGATHDLPVQYLSGGNKQKTVIARCIYSNTRVYIFDEPTKSIDIAGKVEIYNIMNELVQRGCAVILVTSDFSELVGMCNRIIVLNQGQQIMECERGEVTKEQLYSYVNIPSNPN